MATSNDLNISDPGIVAFDGTAIFSGRTLTAGAGITITSGTGISGNPTIALAGGGGGNAVQHLTGDTGGSLNPDGSNNINILGTGSTTVAGSGSTLTAQLTGLTNHAVLVGAGTTTITKIGPSATSGQVFQSAGAAADPAFSTATYPSTASTSGKVLQSDGTNFVQSTATFPSTATATGTLLRADGTNWVATTSTYPTTNAVSTLLYASSANIMAALDTANNGTLVTSNTGVPSILAGPGTTGKILQSNASAAPSFSTATYPSTAGTSGNVLTSDGTNWNSTAPASSASYAFTLVTSNGNPTDSFTYYLQNTLTITQATSSIMLSRFYIPSTGTITKCQGAVTVGATLGSNENCTVAIRLNDTSNTNVTTTLQLTGTTNTFSNTALSTAVTAGDFIEFLFIAPAWGTNPTVVRLGVSVFIS